MTVRTDNSLRLVDEQQFRWIAGEVHKRFSRGIDEALSPSFTVERRLEIQGFRVFIAIYPHLGKPKGVNVFIPYSIGDTIPDVRKFICTAASDCWHQYHYMKEKS